MPPPAKGVELEVVDGITEHSSRVALKGVFQMFGDVVACWVPPIDRRHVDKASIRFGNATAAEAAKQACDAGQVFLQGLPLKVDYRMGGGRRVGNSDLGESGNNNDQDKARAIMETAASDRDRNDRDRDRRHRRSRSRRGHDKRRDRSRSRRRSRDRRRSRSRDRDRDRDRGRRGDAKAEEKPSAPPAPTPAPVALPPSQPAQPPAISSPPPFATVKDASPPMSVASAFPPLEASLPFELPAFDPEAEARRKAELEKAKAERAKQLKRGPGVAALVQGALKRALTQPTVSKKEAEEPERPVAKAAPVTDVAEDSDDEVKALLQRKEQELLAAKKQEQLAKEAKEREVAEKLARERREQALKEAVEAEKELQKKEQETREQRIKASVEAAKRQQAERAAKEAGALYGDMPDPNLEPNSQQATADAALQREMDNKNVANPSSEDRSKVLFLDIDGVLRPARAGGFDISPGESDKGVDTSDFFPQALKALRHIVERTSAKVVLTSEWRRSEPLLKALSDKFTKEQVRPWSSTTVTTLELEKSSDALKSFTERRALEISMWLQEHEREVSGWVVVDDINLALADASKKAKTKPMQPHLVQTWPLCGLTIGNAKTAVRILNGELINKVVVERPVAPVGSGSKK
mmetsp:Transcript_87446/g.183018  ORF Transcript_87446/g.183018 Transcript_87446/m.183018 type:complete len:638 (-) Transcript_87446:90-2003(-)